MKSFYRERADRPDPKDYMYSDLEGVTVGKMPDDVNGQQFLIQNCKVGYVCWYTSTHCNTSLLQQDCSIFVFDHSAAVTIDDCASCQIFVGPVKGRCDI